MAGTADTLTDREARAALGWWLDAGVDVAVADAPRKWLHAPAATAPAADAKPAPPPPLADLPADFSAFRAWLETSEDQPLNRPGARRILPVGTPGAELMIIADVARDEDGDAPIGGEAWALALRMLAAIRIAPEHAYVASIACFSAAGTKLGDPELQRCAEIARRHVSLVRPKRLLLFGEAPAKALTGDPLTRARNRVHRVEGVRTVATIHPRMLLQRPEHKALAWRDLLVLMEEDR